MGHPSDASFARWMSVLEERHLAELTFPEVSRALRALSSAYVERRGRLREGAALSGAGKRAAFALFYGPLHFLIVRHVATTLGVERVGSRPLVDLGCGTGAAGAAYAACATAPSIVGIDRNPWALTEAADTYRHFGVKGRTARGDIATAPWPQAPATFLAAFALNELADRSREDVMRRLIERAGRGDTVLIVEPLAGFVAPWWRRWRAAMEQAGGRADEWRVKAERPGIVAKLDRAAGLDHPELTARSLWLST